MKQLKDLTEPGEHWALVTNTGGKYAVSNLGRIASFYKNNTALLKPHPCRNGYLKVVFYTMEGEKTVMPHRLVATYFVDNPDNKLEVNHINGIKTDNRAENLEWVTRGENCRHAVAKGLHRGFEKGHQVANRHRGERSPTAVLTEDQVKSIRADRAAGLKQRELAEKYKIKMSTVRSALAGWKHIT
jgi:hypothetical protein